jgi:hypothetical protein
MFSILTAISVTVPTYFGIDERPSQVNWVFPSFLLPKTNVRFHAKIWLSFQQRVFSWASGDCQGLFVDIIWGYKIVFCIGLITFVWWEFLFSRLSLSCVCCRCGRLCCNVSFIIYVSVAVIDDRGRWCMLNLLVIDVMIYFSIYQVRDYFNPDQVRSWNDKPLAYVLIPFLFSFVTRNWASWRMAWACEVINEHSAIILVFTWFCLLIQSSVRN